MSVLLFLGGFGQQKTKPILSFKVSRSEFSGKMKKGDLIKQSQYAGLWPEILSTKLETRNELKEYIWKNKANISEKQKEKGKKWA